MGLLLAAGICAAIDWVAVLFKLKPVQYIFKPLAVFLLIPAVAFFSEPGIVSDLFIAALALSVAGDVFLMVPGDRFVAGLGAFLFAHTFYIAAFLSLPQSLLYFGLGLLGVVVIAFVAGPVILRGVRRADAGLVYPVMGYALVLSMMVAAAAGTGMTYAAAGGALFLVSDLLLGWDRFVRQLPLARVLVVVVYHLAQFCLALAAIAA